MSVSSPYTDSQLIEGIRISCCETGIGKLATGEGMIAINRGFLYAGANNIVYTLFKIPDQSSAQLTTTFYQEILKGKPYHQALGTAKKELSKKKS